MLIVSQDRTRFVNMDSIDGFTVSDYGNTYNFFACCHTREFPLGEYKTKKRAKQVLQKIVNKSKSRIRIRNMVFYMPQE